MDTGWAAATEITAATSQSANTPKKLHRPVEEKRRIVEETLVPGASVARVARAHGVNANQVFHWRNLYRSGGLTSAMGAVKLLPVTVAESPTMPSEMQRSAARLPGAMHIELRHGQVRIEGNVDGMLLRLVLELLRA